MSGAAASRGAAGAGESSAGDDRESRKEAGSAAGVFTGAEGRAVNVRRQHSSV
jgi:hypothetical protein